MTATTIETEALEELIAAGSDLASGHSMAGEARWKAALAKIVMPLEES